jgi:competence protein ComEC
MQRTSGTPSQILRIFLSVFLIIVAILSYTAGFEPSQESVKYAASEDVILEGRVASAQEGESRQQLTIDTIIINGESREDKAILFIPLFPHFSFGDKVSLRCDLQQPEPFDGFAYDRYLASQDVYAICFSNYAPALLHEGEMNSIKARLMQFRVGVQDRIKMMFGEPHAALLEGLLLGEKRFSNDWDKRFLKTGTTHIVAASGYNVAVVTFLVSGFLYSIGVRRQKAFALILAAILGYVMIAGAEAAVMRAGVMGALILLSRQLGRRASMMNVILLTASIMLFINPKLLRDDVGFQLSILSTIGLIYFSPILSKKLRFIPEDFALRESVSATLAATLFTLPIVFLSFGQLSIVGPVVNMLVLPILPYAMFFGGVSIVASFLWFDLAAVLSTSAWALLELMLVIIQEIAKLPFASFTINGSVSFLLGVVSFGLLYFLWKFFLRK